MESLGVLFVTGRGKRCGGWPRYCTDAKGAVIGHSSRAASSITEERAAREETCQVGEGKPPGSNNLVIFLFFNFYRNII